MDEKGNQFVWVPVADASVMYEESETDIALYGGSGVTTKKYSKSEIISGVDRTIPSGNGSGNWRNVFAEPQLNGYDYSKWSESNPSEIGFDSAYALGQELVQIYEDVITSVDSCKGFFIGRYELAKSGVIPGVIDTGNWYGMYGRSKEITNSQNVHSTMVLGCQWDVMCYWIENRGYDIDTSDTWGNYQGVTSEEAGGKGTVLPTGYSELWKACNIYDLAGNGIEWTQEASDDSFRCVRGGDAWNPPYGCKKRTERWTYMNYGSSTRVVLYIR